MKTGLLTMCRRLSLVALTALLALLATPALAQWGTSCPAHWLGNGGMGVSTHYFALHAEDRDRVADGLDVDRLADQVQRTGAAWMIVTLHHQNWVLMAPNEAFAQRVGSRNFMSRRDVPAALIKALRQRGIHVILYVNLRLDPESNAAPEVRRGMGPWPPADATIANVAAVYREFSLRYGKGIAGWWLDGAGIPAYGGAPERDRWFQTLTNAMRAGNPQALVAFNPGVRVQKFAPQDDYTAGESDELPAVPQQRCLDGAQWHAWTYLGGWWGSDGLRFSDRQLCRFAAEVLAKRGAVTLEFGTWGVQREGLNGADRNMRQPGTADPAQIDQLARIFQRDTASAQGRLALHPACG